jgi:uncharacterized membrane protein YcaP (DUF421 family)
MARKLHALRGDFPRFRRKQGVLELGRVKLAVLETDGQVSVIEKDQGCKKMD